jgi:hypothetical protein
MNHPSMALNKNEKNTMKGNKAPKLPIVKSAVISILNAVAGNIMTDKGFVKKLNISDS